MSDETIIVIGGRQMVQLIAAFNKNDAPITFEEDGFSLHGVKFVLSWIEPRA